MEDSTVLEGQGQPQVTPPTVDPIQVQPTLVPPPTPIPTPTPPPVEETPEVPEFTGLFNEGLPEELEGDVAIEGLFKFARELYPNLDFNRAMGSAWESLDPSKVDLAYIGSIVGADNAKYVASYFTDIVSGYSQNFNAGLEEWARGVKEQFGGEGNWQRVTETFKTHADEATAQYVIGLLDSAKESERNIGVNIIKNFVTPYGVIPKQGRPVSNTTAIPGQGTQGLSAQQFQAKVAELQRAGKYSPDAVAELREARMLGAKMGL